MKGNPHDIEEPIEEQFVVEDSHSDELEARLLERNIVSAESAFSATIPVEVEEYQQRLEMAPSQLAVFADFENADLNVLSNNGYEDEEQMILDYYEDCAEADFVPIKSVIEQIRSSSEWLHVQQYLARAGAYSLKRVCTKFCKIAIEQANLSVGGLLEITKALTGLEEMQIFAQTQEELPPSDNKLQVLFIVDSGISSNSQLLCSLLPGISLEEYEAAKLEAEFNLGKLEDTSKGATELSEIETAALLNFNSNEPRPFEQEVRQDKSKPAAPVQPAMLGETVPFHTLMKHLNLTHVNPTGMCLQRIIETCKVLEQLDLSHNALGDEVCLQFCESLEHSQITSLKLSGNELTDEFLISIPQYLANSVVEELTISRNKFSCAGAICFSTLLADKKGYFERLDISYNSIGDLGCVSLLALGSGAGFYDQSMYEQINSIFMTYAGAKGTVLPKKLPQAGEGDFHSISVAHCMAGVVTAAEIVATLSNTQNIELLDISGNRFSDAGWYGIMKALVQRVDQEGLIGTFRITFHRFTQDNLLPEGSDGIEEILQKVQQIDPEKVKVLEVLK